MGKLIERLKQWWRSGYVEEEDEYYRHLLSRSSEDSTLERKAKTLERKGKALERKRKQPKRKLETLEQASQTLEPGLEPQSLRKKARGRSSRIPSCEDLEDLKEALGIGKGCLQYKQKGNSVYLVVYNPEKKGYNWKRLGTLTDLRREAELKKKVVDPQPVP